MKLRSITLIAAITALVAIAATSGGANAAIGETVQPTATTPIFDTLGDAVVSGKLDRAVLETLLEDGSVDALVTVGYTRPLTSSPSTLKTRAAALEQTFRAKEAVALAAADASEVEVIRPYDNLPTTFVRFDSAEALLDVVNAPDVQFVRANTPVPVSDAESIPLIRQPEAAASGHVGAGTYVAVLDTGVDYRRQPFGCTEANAPETCKVAGLYDFDKDTETALDDDGHGTNVSGIVSLVAPGTKLLVYDVFTNYRLEGEDALLSPTASQLAAINHLIGLKRAGYNVVAVNLSLGGEEYVTGNCNAGIGLTVARDWGILPTISAGNSAQVNGKFRNGISEPACDTNAISVGAVYDSNLGRGIDWRACIDRQTAQDKITCFSQTGPNLDILAPGALITAAGITQAGTSQAAPHVAGAVAVLAAAKYGNQLYRRAEADLIEKALVSSGPTIVDPRIGRSFHRLDLPAAVDALLADPSPTIPTNPTNPTDPAVPDTTAPVVKNLVAKLTRRISRHETIVKINWSATDASGISEYVLYARTGAGGWVKQSVPAKATSVRFILEFNTRYQFAVQALDAAGNWSARALTRPLTPRLSNSGRPRFR